MNTHDARARYAYMVLDARLFVRKRAFGLELTPRESKRLGQMPEDVQHAVIACKPEGARYRSSYLDNPQTKLRLLQADPPKHASGFKPVMDAIARQAGCRPTTLYLWTQDLTQGTLRRRRIWRPKDAGESLTAETPLKPRARSAKACHKAASNYPAEAEKTRHVG
jgi:hypothetical protein